LYNDVYACHARGEAVKFTNADLGGGKDTWIGIQKTGTIYCTLNGGDKVQQMSQMEGEVKCFS